MPRNHQRRVERLEATAHATTETPTWERHLAWHASPRRAEILDAFLSFPEEDRQWIREHLKERHRARYDTTRRHAS